LAVRAAVYGILPELNGGVIDLSLVHLRTIIVIAQIWFYTAIASMATLVSQRYMDPVRVSGSWISLLSSTWPGDGFKGGHFCHGLHGNDSP
jgi:hypothetical protein